MRISNGMLISNLMRNYKHNLSNMEELQNQLSSGKRIRRPSDDPSGASKALKLRTDLSSNEQYIKNVDNAVSWLNITETALRDIGDTLQRARELAVRAAHETLVPADRATVANEIEQLQRHLFQLGNSTYAGRHIFAGYRTDTPAFAQSPGAILFQGNNGEIAFEVSIGNRIAVNVSGGAGGAEIAGIYDVLERLKNDLRSPVVLPTGGYIQEIDLRMNQVLANRSMVGAKINRFEMIRTRLMDSETNYTELLSKNEDADIARVIMHLKEAEVVYNASLAAGARIIMPTLVDFLR